MAAVIGGYVVRDPAMPSFVGRYLWADFFVGEINSVSFPGATDNTGEGVTISSPVAFGEDGGGGLYVVSMDGVVYKLSESAGALQANPVVNGLDTPMNVGGPPGDTARLFIVERDGRVLLHKDGTTTTFLDVRTQVSTTPGERGMSSIAFAPDYATSGRFYVMYTDDEGAIHIEEFRRSATDPNDADESTRRNVLVIPHPNTPFHYGGQLQFGPDGYLYLSTGDGGGDNDEFDNAQDLGKLLGKLVRINPLPPTPAPPRAAPPRAAPPRAVGPPTTGPRRSSRRPSAASECCASAAWWSTPAARARAARCR